MSYPKKIVLGVCGSIAAYKAAVLVRLLVKSGAEVRVIMTHEATNFIAPLTLSTLSKNPVLTDLSDPETGEWNNHVALGLWADALVIAPASANTLAKLANGLCDNLLSATYLSARCPVYVAPAMDLDMWAHPAVQGNVKKIIAFGTKLISPGTGELASGLSGEGRMAEPEEIVAMLKQVGRENFPLEGKRALVSAGPTYEAIDPVRFVGNHSSGKMGFAIATVLRDLGASVTLVSGPVSLPDPAGIRTLRITSAAEMLHAMEAEFSTADITVMSAAVADFSPEIPSATKIKKQGAEGLTITLTKTQDILKLLGEKKRKDQLLVGFALETDNEGENARKKLHTKNLDLIVLNSLNDAGAGFGVETNKVTFITAGGGAEVLPLKTKPEVAADLGKKIVQLLEKS